MWIRALLILASYAAVFGVFTALAWLVYRHAGAVGLAVLWLLSSLAYGYIGYRRHCGQGLACDIAGIPYWQIYTPQYALVGGVTFACASLVVVYRRRQGAAASLRIRDVSLAALLAMIGWFTTTPFGLLR